ASIAKCEVVRRAPILDMVEPRPEAKFVVFRCFDSMDGPTLDGRDSRYYESIDLDDAHHVQTILAYELNDKPLPVSNGAPLRCRVERQLGYKQAKYIRAIELVESFAAIRGGKGGYWEDEGYGWCGGMWGDGDDSTFDVARRGRVAADGEFRRGGRGPGAVHPDGVRQRGRG